MYTYCRSKHQKMIFQLFLEYFWSKLIDLHSSIHSFSITKTLSNGVWSWLLQYSTESNHLQLSQCYNHITSLHFAMSYATYSLSCMSSHAITFHSDYLLFVKSVIRYINIRCKLGLNWGYILSSAASEQLQNNFFFICILLSLLLFLLKYL